MRIATGVISRHKRRVLAALLVVSGLALLLSLPVQNSAHIQNPGTEELLYVIETPPGTASFLVGRSWDINIVLFNKYKARVPAGHDRRLTVTATTLETLESAKKALPPRAQPRSRGGYDNNRLVLGRGQSAVQIVIKQGPKEDDKDVHVVSYQPGVIHIYAESDGVTAGDTVVFIRDLQRPTVVPRPRGGALSGASGLTPIAWQPDSAKRLRLQFSPTTAWFRPFNGEQFENFRVLLKSADDDQPFRAPENLRVVLEVEGYARFDPDLPLKIPAGEEFSSQAALKTAQGGPIKVKASASAQGFRIKSAEMTYFVEPGQATNKLQVHLERNGAVANGLDGVKLVVSAWQDELAIAPEDEGLQEQVINFSLLGDASGVRFENGNSEVRIQKGQKEGKIKLFSTSPVSDLKVVAAITNGKRKEITTKDDATPIKFSFPWFQLFCAAIGGGVFPLLWRQNKTTVITGLLLGAVFFGLALFGAISSDPQNLGTVSLKLAKLPTEAPFASFILGLIGSVLIGFVFKRQLGIGGDRLAAETQSVDTTRAQTQSNPGSDSNDQEKPASPLKHQDDLVDREER